MIDGRVEELGELLSERVMALLPGAIIAPEPEIVITGGVWRQIMGHKARIRSYLIDWLWRQAPALAELLSDCG